MPRILGLAIGVERYDEPERNPITGAVAQAKVFRSWLIDVAGADPAHALLRVSPAANGDKAADRTGIVSGFKELAAACGTGSPADGDTVLVYLSGHGYRVGSSDAGADGEDLFLPADWSSDDPESGGIRLAQVSMSLKGAAGQGDHFWFVDACRNEASPGQGATIRLQPSGRAHPLVHHLFSSSPGTTVPVAGPFSAALLQALNGVGRVKRREGSTYWVVFNRLAEVVSAEAMAAHLAVEPKTEGGPGHIVPWPSVLDVTVTVRVLGAPEGSGLFQMSSDGQDTINRRASAGESTIRLPPNDYHPQLVWDDVVHRPVGLEPGAALDCYSDATVEFDLGTPPEPEAGPPKRVVVTRQRGTHRRMGLGDRPANATRRVEMGVQQLDSLRVLDGGIPVALRDTGSWALESTGGGDDLFVIAINELTSHSKLHDQVLFRATAAADGAVPLTSLAQGVDDDIDDEGMLLPDAGSLLSLMAASAVFDTAPYRDLVAPFPCFDDLGRDSTAVAVLLPTSTEGQVTVDEQDPIPLRPFFHLEQTASRAWTTLAPGPHRINVALEDRSPLIVQSVAMPGRATVLVCTAPVPSAVRQFALQPGHLLPSGTDVHDLLRDVRFSEYVQMRYASPQTIDEAELGDEAVARLRRLLSGDWIDPITVCAALWDRARQQGAISLANTVELAAHRIRKVMPAQSFADLETLRDLAQARRVRARQSPALFLEAAIALPDLPDDPPGAALDFSGPWTAWKPWPR